MAVTVTNDEDGTGNAENNDPGRSRLHWQCRRGMLELDLVLQDFLERQYDRATPDERRAFEALLNYPDDLLLQYVMGRVIPTDRQLANVVVRLRSPASA